MNRLWYSFTLSAAVMLAGAGCADAPSTSKTESGAADGDVAVAPATNSATSDSAPGVELTEPAETPDAKTQPPAPLASTEPTPDPEAPVDPLIKGLEFPNVDIKQLFAEQKSGYDANPKDNDAVTGYIGLIANLGMYHSQQGDQARAHEAFLRAGDLAEKAIADGVQLPAGLIGTVHYNTACVKSLQGKTEEALALLEKAFASGFNDIRLLKSDTDLDAVRQLPSFSEKLAAWEAAAKELMIAHAKEELAAGESFPFEFALTDVTGQPVKLTDFAGKVCIVDIWGTWCPPCREEIPSFIQLQEKFGAAGFQMVGLNQESGKDEETKLKKVTDYIGSAGINYPCALIDETVMDQVPDFGGFPTTLFIDRTGKVRLKAVGLHEYGYLEAVVETLLAEEYTAPEPAAEPAKTPEPAAASEPEKTPEPAATPEPATPEPATEAPAKP